MCMCGCICYLWVCKCTFVCRAQKKMFSVFLYCHLPYFSRQSLSLNLELGIQLAGHRCALQWFTTGIWTLVFVFSQQVLYPLNSRSEALPSINLVTYTNRKWSLKIEFSNKIHVKKMIVCRLRFEDLFWVLTLCAVCVSVYVCSMCIQVPVKTRRGCQVLWNWCWQAVVRHLKMNVGPQREQQKLWSSLAISSALI